MEPQMLIDSASANIPAPFWFVQFFKWLGFTLHMVPMNLWYAGLLVALWLHLRGDQHARRFAARLLQQMPVIVALGVNLGVVPLLFVQLAYYKVFYPATILMAWFWLAIIGLLIPAYYGVYVYAWGIQCSPHTPCADTGPARGSYKLTCPVWRIAAGWCAAVFFLVIGFIFANGLSLMDHVARWPELWKDHSMAGAALGTALNVSDPTLVPRWLLMFTLAIGTTAVWVLVDAFFLAGKTTDEAYRQWVLRFARNLYTYGMIWAAVVGAWYVFRTWEPDLRNKMFAWPLVMLTVVTAVAPGLPWALMMIANWCSEKRVTVAAIALCQFGVLGVNAASRQVVQNLNLKPFLDVSAQAEDVQWGPLAMFLIAFVIGLAVVGWMVGKVIVCKADSSK